MLYHGAYLFATNIGSYFINISFPVKNSVYIYANLDPEDPNHKPSFVPYLDLQILFLP